MLSVAASAARTREPKSFSTTAAAASSAGRRKKRSSSVARCLAGTGTVIVRRVFRLFFLSVRNRFPLDPSILSSLSRHESSRIDRGLFHSLFLRETTQKKKKTTKTTKTPPDGETRKTSAPVPSSAQTQESPKIHYSLGFWIFEISFLCL